jgi:hypothetical protein
VGLLDLFGDDLEDLIDPLVDEPPHPVHSAPAFLRLGSTAHDKAQRWHPDVSRVGP